MKDKTNSLVIALPIVAAMGCWLLFTASFSFHELALGAAFTALTAIVMSLAWRSMGVLFRPTFRQVICLWRLPWYILHDSIEVSVTLAKDLIGIRAGSHLRATDFPSPSDKHSSARAVLATTGTTMTPSIIVLGIANNFLLLHQLERSSLPRMIKDLETR
jgi:multisubunit Na+/H+ antiporter MnhE subunit